MMVRAVAMASPVERWTTLAGALAARPLSVLAAAPGEASWTDGHRLWLDPALPLAQQREACMAQALLVEAGSLEYPGLRRLVGRRAAISRYMVLELARALRRSAACLPVEFEERARGWLSGVPESGSVEISLALALDARTAMLELPAHLGRLRPARLSWKRVAGRAGQILRKTPMREARLESIDEDEDTEEATGKLLRAFSSPLAGAAGSLLLKILGLGRTPGDTRDQDGADGGAMALGEETMMSDAPGADAEQTARRPTQGSAKMPPARWHYPEWSVAAQTYRPNWTHVHEITPMGRSMAERVDVLASTSIRRQIARIGLEFARHRAQRDGPDFDLERLVRHAVGRHAGEVDERLYLATRRTRRDLALLVLLDVSQSTGDRDAQGRRAFDQQREMTRQLLKASVHLGDRVAVYGFHSWGRHLVRFLRIKHFSELMSPAVGRRLEALEPAGLTRLGAAIRHATHLVDHDGQTRHRMVLLLTDGFAYDDEYEGAHAEADAGRALQEATERGIACVCLNIGSEQDDERLRRLYGEAAYLRCSNLHKSVPALRRLMRSAMRQADSRQRRSPNRHSKEAARP